MPAGKQWDDEESDSSSAPASPVLGAVRRGKFADEEESDVLESWDAAEDSEVEREKAKKAAEAKAKAEAEAAANKKSRTQRIADRQAANRRQAEGEDESSEEEETAAERAQRMRRTEKESDLKHAEDLFGGVGLSLANGRKATTAGSAVRIDSDPSKTIDLSTIPLFNPSTKGQFETLRNTMVPIIGGNYRKAHYTMFLQEFAKQLAKDLPSDQIKKIGTTLTTLSNEKLKEEKAAEKGGKKTKAQKTKTQLVTNRPNTTDVGAYDDDAFGDDDFM
ncbi:putative eukaryotic translation initiation factor 3 subunit J [Rosellinia necatrix]|uniref:Eukaryotic translation initiation factor 3 subunit J n=1 Tax=Rosellinia necatrix TaxID=77044 RepID=A0A1S7UJQ6_ROSNE|nr:putative eukaryotic translation initiation factor 3 subunit J [Rosellinia necatrix]